MKANEPADIIVIDETEACPYLAGETARMPLRMPLARITLEQADQRLAEGHRRTGEFIYQTNCPSCSACQPIRLDVGEFQFSRNHRRTLNRGDRKFQQRIGPLEADQQRASLFNKHRKLRGLAKRETSIDLNEYAWGFVRSCFESFEITYWLDDRLVCLAVCDLGATSVSAVYTFYDPEIESDSIGTYSVLKQIQYCQEQGLRHLYLGYYVAGSKHMRYKARYTPCELLVDGKWLKFVSTEALLNFRG